jgi:hypothetical protein
LFYNSKEQKTDYLLRDVLEDTIQAISLLKLLHKNESEDELILYQAATLELNDSVELSIKDIKQLPTLSRMVLLKLSTALQGLQDHVLNIIEPISTQPSSLEPSNRAINTALYTNKILAKPSADLILPEGLK